MTDTELRQAGTPAAAKGTATAPDGAAGRPGRPGKRRRRFGPDTTKGTVAKIVLLGLVDALAVYVLMMLFLSESWGALAVSLRRRPGDQLDLPAHGRAPGEVPRPRRPVPAGLPGLRGHLHRLHRLHQLRRRAQRHQGGRDRSLIQLTAQKRVPDSPAYKVDRRSTSSATPSSCWSPTRTATVSLGSTEPPLEEVSDAGTDSTGKADALDGYTTLNFQEIVANQHEILGLAVRSPTTRTTARCARPTAATPTVYKLDPDYDEAADTFTDTETGDGLQRQRQGRLRGRATARRSPRLADRRRLRQLRPRLHRARASAARCSASSLWTFAFAIALGGARPSRSGLFLAIVFNDARMRGKKVYRIADDPALRLPGVPLGAGLGGHAQPAVRLHQPGAARRRRRSRGSRTRGWPRSACSS